MNIGYNSYHASQKRGGINKIVVSLEETSRECKVTKKPSTEDLVNGK
jgi:hypothetical protein